MSELFEFNDLSILPMCVLKDDMILGERIGKVCINDVFKPNPKMLPRVMVGEYVFTKYHFHDGVELIRIGSGKATAVINNKAYKVKAGDVLIINPYEAHGLYLDSNEIPFSRSCVIFKPKDIFPTGKGGSVFDGLRALRFENHVAGGGKNGALAECLDRIVDIAENGGAARTVEEISALIAFYSTAISEKVVSDSDSASPYRREFVTRIADYVADKLTGNISTEAAANYCKYSTEHFCRLFKECFGETFKDYVTSCRIKLAKDRIDEGEALSVFELSKAAGFSSVNHFSSMFSRHLGVTPSEYIKAKRGKKDEIRKI